MFGDVSWAPVVHEVGGACARVQLEGGFGRQLGDGACMAQAKRSLERSFVIGRGEIIFSTTDGAIVELFLRGMLSVGCYTPRVRLYLEGM